MTQFLKAIEGVITLEMEQAAKDENRSPEYMRQGIAEGTIIITQNVRHKTANPLAIGKGLRTKVNANIGTSGDHADIDEELEKLDVAIAAGADTVMDLSIGGEVDEVRRAVLEKSTVPIGTVPLYQAALDARKRNKSFVELTADEPLHSDAGIGRATQEAQARA
jgi:phosphomethylpyrimidine synthase